MSQKIQTEVNDVIDAIKVFRKLVSEIELECVRKKLTECEAKILDYIAQKGYDEGAGSALDLLGLYGIYLNECHNIFTGQEDLESEAGKKWLNVFVFGNLLRGL